MWNGMVKVGSCYAGRIWSITMWNRETDEVVTYNCEDTDYGIDGFRMGILSYDISEGDRIHLLTEEPFFDGSEEIEREWEDRKYRKDLEAGHVREGMIVRVVKGRKVKVGTEGKVVRISEWRDRYGRLRTIYVHLEDGQRTSIDNVIPIA